MRASSFSIINCYFGGLKLVLGKKTTLGLLHLSNLALTCSSFSESEVFSSEDTENSISEDIDNLQLENHNWVSSDDESDDFSVGECSTSKTLKMKGDRVKGEDIDSFPLENHNWVSSEDESDDSEECLTSKTLKMKEDGVKGIKSILMNHGCNLDFGNGQRIDELKVIRILNDLFDGSSNAAIAFHFFRWSESCSGYKHTIRTVCTMIHILVSGNMNHIAVDLIQYLVTNNYGSEEWHHLVFNVLKETHGDSRVLVTVYSMLVNSYIRENIIHMALLLINQMKILHIYPTIGVCNSLLRALLNSNQIESADSAWEVLEEMHNRGMVNASIMSLFIHHYCAEGSIESACKLLVEMVNYGCKPDVVAYTIVINALCKMGHLRKATAILFKMIYMGVPADSVSVTSVIDGYCKARRLEEAMNVLKISCIRSNVFVYNSFISELCRSGKMIEATRLFHEMSELGIQPDCCSYTTIIQGYCKVDDLVIALMYLGEMFKRGFRPVIVTYTVLVESYCKIGNLEMAEKLFNMVRRDGLKPDVVMYNTLMNGYGKNDHLNKAYELFDMMRHADVSPDAATYNIIIHGLAGRGFVKEAIDILEELTTRKGFSMDILTFTNLIAGFSKTGSCEEACRVWSWMSKHVKPDVVIYSALLNSYCKARRMEEAKTRFREMLADGLDPDIILYNTLINGFCNIGNIAEACRLVRMMAEQGIIPNHVTYGALVHAFEKKKVENPAENAAIRIQEILLKYEINVDTSQYIYMEPQSFS